MRLTFLAFAENPDHPLIAAAQAFLAESQLKLPGREGSRSEVIERAIGLCCRTIPSPPTPDARDGESATSTGSKAAEYQEAQVAYQRTLGHSDVDSYDANRALLGMGYAFLGLTKWRRPVRRSRWSDVIRPTLFWWQPPCWRAHAALSEKKGA
ncbi:MAG: hypothetical protein U0361_03635 [Nitrospiraceae bacterium]